MDPRGGYISKILHVKTKESGPVGGGAPPRSANDLRTQTIPYVIGYGLASTPVEICVTTSEQAFSILNAFL